MCFPGNYKVQVFDYSVKAYMPTAPGVGMHVEVKDPVNSVVLSRVSYVPLIKWSFLNSMLVICAVRDNFFYSAF